MSKKRYPYEFKIEAVKQVVDRGHSVADVATVNLQVIPGDTAQQVTPCLGLFYEVLLGCMCSVLETSGN